MNKFSFFKRLLIVSVISIFISGALLADGAGIIPVSWDKKKNVMFLLGYENSKKQYEDFGGSKDKKDKNLKITAAREFEEETSNVFGFKTSRIARTILPKCKYVGYKYKTYFLHVKYILASQINSHLKKNKNTEIGHVKWFSLRELSNAYNTKVKLSDRVRGQLKKAAKKRWYGLSTRYFK